MTAITDACAPNAHALRHRKRLGQYFTGTSLGRVLAALAQAERAESIIDPMAGSGDLLVACREVGARPNVMGAIDIDPALLGECRRRVAQAACISASAFDPCVLSQLPRQLWDLVIANPPYVRYQSLSDVVPGGPRSPSGVEVRNGLLGQLALLPALDETDRRLLGEIAAGYSGLADLAVPAWILCAALVAPGGRLAVVLPESWLNRDYAIAVHYILMRWFEIEFIVEDEHAAWFADAQVKTNLLVARRVRRKAAALCANTAGSFLRIAVSGRASGTGGACSRLAPGQAEPERHFAAKARTWLASGQGYEDELVRASLVPTARVVANLQGACARQKWFGTMGEACAEAPPFMPHELDGWLARSATASVPVSLTALGVRAGQGLRTGANDFFYGERGEDGRLALPRLLPGARWDVPDDLLLPAVRRQADLPGGFLMTPTATRGRVLDLRRHALAEDRRKGGDLAERAYACLTGGAADMVRAAALSSVSAKGGKKRLWELSAVAPNVRKADPSSGRAPRYWYMLPDFTRRHRPDLFMARINAASPQAYLNRGAQCVIDANFVTLWIEGGVWMRQALLAFLNSAWVRVALEYSAAVMGGGALKVEAAHVRRLPVPALDEASMEALGRIGAGLARATRPDTLSSLLARADRVVAAAALGREPDAEDMEALSALARRGREKRRRQRNGGQ